MSFVLDLQAEIGAFLRFAMVFGPSASKRLPSGVAARAFIAGLTSAFTNLLGAVRAGGRLNGKCI